MLEGVIPLSLTAKNSHCWHALQRWKLWKYVK